MGERGCVGGSCEDPNGLYEEYRRGAIDGFRSPYVRPDTSSAGKPLWRLYRVGAGRPVLVETLPSRASAQSRARRLHRMDGGKYRVMAPFVQDGVGIRE